MVFIYVAFFSNQHFTFDHISLVFRKNSIFSTKFFCLYCC